MARDTLSAGGVRGSAAHPLALMLLLIATGIFVAGGCSLLGAQPSAAVRVAPGECFDQPSDATDTSNVVRRLCELPHDAEAISSSTHPAEPGAPYPTVDELRSFMRSTCVPAFAAYTGSPYDNESGLDFGLFYPVAETWSAGERDVVCYVSYTDGTKLTGSLRGAGTSIAPSP